MTEEKRVVNWSTVGMLVLYFIGGGLIAYVLASWFLPDWLRIPAVVLGSMACLFVGGVVRSGDDPVEDIRDRIHTRPRK